jgi:L-2-hydroxyglutarate oxidase
MVNKKEVLIVGGGIVGLATALRIMRAKPHTRLTLIEKEASVAKHQTGHNS